MFCSNCGAEAAGNFCWRCGAALNAPSPAPTAAPNPDWSEEIRYEHLIRNPEVRERLSRHAALARKRLSTEEALALWDKVVPMPVSAAGLGAVLARVYTRLGVKTGKERSETFTAPAGTLIVSTLCSFARHGQLLRRVQQLEDGCAFEATLPSDLRSWEGTLHVAVRRTAAGTQIDAATNIGGQAFDWGKSKHCLSELFSDLRENRDTTITPVSSQPVEQRP